MSDWRERYALLRQQRWEHVRNVMPTDPPPTVDLAPAQPDPPRRGPLEELWSKLEPMLEDSLTHGQYKRLLEGLKGDPLQRSHTWAKVREALSIPAVQSASRPRPSKRPSDLPDIEVLLRLQSLRSILTPAQERELRLKLAQALDKPKKAAEALKKLLAGLPDPPGG